MHSPGHDHRIWCLKSRKQASNDWIHSEDLRFGGLFANFQCKTQSFFYIVDLMFCSQNCVQSYHPRSQYMNWSLFVFGFSSQFWLYKICQACILSKHWVPPPQKLTNHFKATPCSFSTLLWRMLQNPSYGLLICNRKNNNPATDIVHLAVLV